MADYKAPLRDIDFVLNDFLNSEQHYAGLQGCEQLSSDLMDAIISEGAKFAENVVNPIAATGDEQGCKFVDGKVSRKPFASGEKAAGRPWVYLLKTVVRACLRRLAR